MKLEKAFGAVLCELRTGKALTQEKLALNAGLDRTFISLLERGQRQPSLGTIFLLAKELGIRPSLLVAWVEDRSANKT